jgi:hypothetical protein
MNRNDASAIEDDGVAEDVLVRLLSRAGMPGVSVFFVELVFEIAIVTSSIAGYSQDVD